MRIYVASPGESLNGNLTEAGLEQAERIAAALEKSRIQRFFADSASQLRQTAKVAYPFAAIPWNREPLLDNEANDVDRVTSAFRSLSEKPFGIVGLVTPKDIMKTIIREVIDVKIQKVYDGALFRVSATKPEGSDDIIYERFQPLIGLEISDH